MRRDILELDTSVSGKIDALDLSLADVEAIRLVLSGGSVIDWHKAAFTSMDDVHRTLANHLLDPDDPRDRERLRYLFFEALSYVEEYLQLRVPTKIRDVDDVRQIFLWASDASGFRRTQVLCCMILKLMHVMQHLEAADLRVHTAVSEQMLLDLAHARIARIGQRLKASGLPIVAFYGSRKTRAAVITKLLCKRDDVATTVFDKLRYRVVVPRSEHLVDALGWMSRHLFAVNQIVPGQSHNNLLDPELVPARLPADEQDAIQPLIDDPKRAETRKNEFSGQSYQMINFVIDVPVNLPDHVLPPGSTARNGRTVYITTEFQLVDEVTAKRNEAGDNAHALYKRRQHERVRRRLTRGQYDS